MLNVGAAELLVILLVALLVLGPDKLPNAARQVGRAMGELRRLSSGFQAEVRDAFHEPVESRPGSSSSPVGPASDPVGVTAIRPTDPPAADDLLPEDVPPGDAAATVVDPADLLPEDAPSAGPPDDRLPEDQAGDPAGAKADEVRPGDGAPGEVPPA